MAYVRTVRTASGATAVQIVYSMRRGARRIEHLGSGHGEAEVEALKAAARQRLAQGQAALDLDLDLDSDGGGAAGPARIVSSRAGHLWDALERAYGSLGLDEAVGSDTVFRHCVPGSGAGPDRGADQQVRLPAGAGRGRCPRGVVLDAEASPARLRRSLVVGGTGQGLRGARGPGSGGSLVLYDVSTLYFETHTGDGFREPGFSKERRLEPQITIGLLTDATGFPLALEAFEGNKAECDTRSHALSGSR